jgi:hypothetical protein
MNPPAAPGRPNNLRSAIRRDVVEKADIGVMAANP